MGHKIVAVKRNRDGELEMFKLDNDLVLTFAECVEAINKGFLDGYNVGKDKLGYDTIRSNRDDDPTNNLQDLPVF